VSKLALFSAQREKICVKTGLFAIKNLEEPKKATVGDLSA